MTSILPIIESLIQSLAFDLGYKILPVEKALYSRKLSGFPLEHLRELFLDLEKEKESFKGFFPSINYLTERLNDYQFKAEGKGRRVRISSLAHG